MLSNTDLMMATDVMEHVLTNRLDVVVLVTGDGDFSYVSSKLRKVGIRVEVAALKEGLSANLSKSANSIIDLSEFFNSLSPPRLEKL